MKFLFILLGVLLLSSSPLLALVGDTKHNLSATNPDKINPETINATAETEECVFCHVPHLSRPEARPLWNREMPITDYIMYESDYLKRLGYSSANNLGILKNTPGALSRQCLSCHDGTIAVGAVYKLRKDIMSGASIVMKGVEVAGTGTTVPGAIPDASSTNFGNDLTNHHPVAIEYNPGLIKTFSSGGSWTPELKLTPDSPIRLYTYGGAAKYVECTSCHNPHTTNAKFLHIGTGNLALNIVQTCTSCHDKTGWEDNNPSTGLAGSVHRTATQTYSDPEVLAKYGTNVVGELGCANCHMPHDAGSTEYLNRQVSEQTCFQGAASTVAGANCHGENGAKDIQTILQTSTYKHPILTEHNLPGTGHTNLDGMYGTGNPDPLSIKGIDWDTNKHAVCMDCHNPHQAQKGTHITAGEGDVWYGVPSATGNDVSPALTGVQGVEPTWPTEWNQPVTFTTLKSAEKEYQICFKCHSYWGIGLVADKYFPSTYTSVTGTLLTDVAWEMNIMNKSGHPVIVTQENRTGSLPSRELGPEQLLEPWILNRGKNTMYCSDCHGNDEEINGDPKGPHGSDLQYLLKGKNKYWPKKPDTITLYAMSDIGEDGTVDLNLDGIIGDDTDLMCKNCHDLTVPHKNWRTQMSTRPYFCVECHVVIPHGSPVSRLIGYKTWPEPYNYNGDTLRMIGWKKNGVYDPLDPGTRQNAWTDAPTSCVNGMGTECHGTNNGGYDVNVMP